MKVRVFAFCFLVAAVAVAASAVTVSTTLVSPLSPPAPAPCQLATVGAHWAGSQLGWADFTCTAGYAGDLTVAVTLIPYHTGSSTLVSVLPIAQVTQSWPKSYRNPKCTFSSLVVSCPLGESAYLKEYAPSTGMVSAEAYIPSLGCFKTKTRLEWYDRARFTKGAQTAETGWTGNCP